MTEWIPITKGPLIEERDAHQAILLPDGDILIAGGYRGCKAIGSSELYTVNYPVETSGSLPTKNNLTIARSHFSLSQYDKFGTPIAAGGWIDDKTPAGAAEVFQLSSKLWFAQEKYPMQNPRYSHSAVYIPDKAGEGWSDSGFACVMGGWSKSENGAEEGVTSTVERNNHNELQWITLKNSLRHAREKHTATFLPDIHKVLLVGGINGDRVVENSELYDMKESEDIKGGSALARYDHTATLLPSGDVLIAGGCRISEDTGEEIYLNTAIIFKTAERKWDDEVTVFDFETSKHCACLMNDGKVMIIGGENIDKNTGKVVSLDHVQIYDPEKNSWKPGPLLNVARCTFTATVHNDKSIVVTGGYIGSKKVTNSVEILMM
jgi:N-acetylneuraminic acid mutarotase